MDARRTSQSLVLSGSVDPSVVAVDAPSGSLYLGASGLLYQKQDAGLTTNWIRIGVTTALSGSFVTPEGGFAVRLTNRTGSPSVKGRIVSAHSGISDAVITTPAGGDMPIGVMYESGVANGLYVTIVVAGLGDVLLETNTGCNGGYVLTVSSTQAGVAKASATAPSAAEHFREVGHTCRVVGAPGVGISALARAVIHFN